MNGKDDIRKKHGHSPDVGDAYVIGCHGLQYIEPIGRHGGGRGRYNRSQYPETSSMAA